MAITVVLGGRAIAWDAICIRTAASQKQGESGQAEGNERLHFADLCSRGVLFFDLSVEPDEMRRVVQCTVGLDVKIEAAGDVLIAQRVMRSEHSVKRALELRVWLQKM